MRVRLLGPLEVDGNPPPGGRRDRVVLVRLALEAGTVVPVDELVEALWADRIPPSAAKVVQGCIVRLRKLLGADAIETVPGGYRLRILRDQVDVHSFVRLAERARAAGDAGDPDRAAHLLGEALALWRERATLELDAAGVDAGEQQRLLELRFEAEELRLEQMLEGGGHGDLPALGRQLVLAAPYRERRWGLLALAQYRDARQADALATVQQARTVLVGELGLEPGPELIELEAAILRHDPSLRSREGQPSVQPDATCPFRGLLPFEMTDRMLFFGRDDAVAAALDRLTAGTLSVVGASGCGKSSLVRAGVAAALEEEGRAVEVTTPGPEPVDRLHRLVERSPRGTTIVIDQFEEVLTHGRPEDVVPLVDLLEAWTAHSPLALTLRADRLADVNEHPRLAALVERNVLLLGPLGPDEVRSAIEGPAKAAGLRVEPGLVEILVRDVGREPGALPLLSHVLRSVWLHREGRTLTLGGYEAVGGLQGAIATTAEAVYADLDPVQAEAMQRLLLRLFDVTVAGEPVRRRLPLEALEQGEPLRSVVDELVQARLVVVDHDGVTVAHEALAAAWPRLAEWLTEDEGNARLRHHVATTSRAWEDMGRPDSELYRGPRLVAAQDWRRAHGEELTAVEQEFLDASAAADDRRRAVLEERLAARTVANRRLRRSVLAVAALLVAALVAGAAAVVQSSQADDARDRAQGAARLADQRALVATVESLRETRRDVAALLAVEAQRLVPGVAARSALFGTFTDDPGFLGYTTIAGLDPVNTSVTAAVAVDERTFAVATSAGALRLVHVDGEPAGAGELTPPGLPGASTLATDADGRRLAHLYDKDEPGLHRLPTVLTLHDLSTGAMRTTELPRRPVSVAVSPDGARIAVAGGVDGALALYEWSTARLVGRIDGPDPARDSLAPPSGAVAFAPDGRLFWSTLDGGLAVVDATTGEVLDRLPPARGLAAPTRQLVVADDRTVLGVGVGRALDPPDASLAAWDVVEGRLLWAGSRPSECLSAVAPTASGVVYCANRFGRIDAVDARTGVPTGPSIDFQLGPVSVLAQVPRGADLVAFGVSRPVLGRWDLSGGGAVVESGAASLTPLAYDPSGDYLTAVDPASRTAQRPFRSPTVLDAVSGAVVDPLDEVDTGTWIGEGRLAVVFTDGTVGTRDVTARSSNRWLGVEDEEGGDERPLSRDLEQATFDGAGGRLVAWYDSIGPDLSVGAPGLRHDVIDTRTGRVIDLQFGLDWGSVPFASGFTADGGFLVTSSSAGLTVLDGGEGGVVARAGLGRVEVAVGGDGLVAVGGPSGEVHQLDVTTLEPRAPSFEAASGAVQGLQLTADSRLLMVRGGDAVRLFDLPSGHPVGGPIAVARPDPHAGAALAPGGGQLAVATESGVALWDLDLDHWVAAACRLAGRNLTHEEWDRHLGALAPYRATCPQFAEVSDRD